MIDENICPVKLNDYIPLRFVVELKRVNLYHRPQPRLQTEEILHEDETDIHAGLDRGRTVRSGSVLGRPGLRSGPHKVVRAHDHVSPRVGTHARSTAQLL